VTRSNYRPVECGQVAMGVTCNAPLTGREFMTGICDRCELQMYAEELGWIADCDFCGLVHDVIDLCPDPVAQAFAHQCVQEALAIADAA